MPEPERRRIAIAGGGTAGHVLAGVAISQAYRRIGGADTYLIGSATGFESWLAPARGEELALIRGTPYHRQSPLGKMSAIVNLGRGYRDARSLLQNRRTQLVIGVGGYPSMSVALAARSLDIPVVIHEANAAPGLANRLIGRFASHVCTGFAETVELFRDCPADCTGTPTGTPIGAGLRGSPAVSPGNSILVMGGSEGSPFLNHVAPELFSAVRLPGLRVRHLAGQRDIEPIRQAYRVAGVEARVDAFIENIEEAYADAQFVIATPGALTLAEIALCGLPSMLVPLRTAANDHQSLNARTFCKYSGAAWVAETEWNTPREAAWLTALLSDPPRMSQLRKRALACARPDAAEQVMRICETLLNSQTLIRT